MRSWASAPIQCVSSPSSFIGCHCRLFFCTIKKQASCDACFQVIPLGFEPKTHSLEGCCSIQLSYGTEPFCGCKISALFHIFKSIFCLFRIGPLGLYVFKSIFMPFMPKISNLASTNINMNYEIRYM